MPPEIIQTLIKSGFWFIFGLIALFSFRKVIIDLFNRIKSTKWPGGLETMFDSSPNSQDKSSPGQSRDTFPTLAPSKPVKWNNSGNLFWLGHDIMWTISALFTMSPRDAIIHGVNQTLHHIRELGFIDTPVEIRLIKLKNDAEASLEKDWKNNKREEYVNEFKSILHYIGTLAEKNQTNFIARPK